MPPERGGIDQQPGSRKLPRQEVLVKPHRAHRRGMQILREPGRSFAIAVGDHDLADPRGFQREDYRARGAPRAQNDRNLRRAPAKSIGHRYAETVDVGVVTEQRATAIDDRVDRTGSSRGRRHLVEQAHHRDLVRHGDAGAEDPRVAQGLHTAREVSRQRVPAFIDRRDAKLIQRRLVQSGREGMRDGIADHAQPVRTAGWVEGGALPHALTRRCSGRARRFRLALPG